MVKRKTGASGSHCGKFWVKWVACSKSWRDWSVRKDFDQGKSFFRPMFGKVIHWIVVIFFSGMQPSPFMYTQTSYCGAM